MVSEQLLEQLSPEDRAKVIEGAKRHQEKIERAVRERRWLDALTLQDRNAGPNLVNNWWEAGLLAMKDLRDLLPNVWVMAEWPVGHLGQRRWVRLFRETGYVFRWTGDARDVSTPPAEPVTVYRGAPLWTRGRGMSWSLEVASAEWFAARWAAWNVPAAVYRATVPAKAVLAMFNDREEREVVVNPNMLQNRVELVREVKAAVELRGQTADNLRTDSTEAQT